MMEAAAVNMYGCGGTRSEQHDPLIGWFKEKLGNIFVNEMTK